MLIVVSAHDHPECDNWVVEQARAEAARSGVRLGEYQGREDILPVPVPSDTCCHVFTAEAVEVGEGAHHATEEGQQRQDDR